MISVNSLKLCWWMLSLFCTHSVYFLKHWLSLLIRAGNEVARPPPSVLKKHLLSPVSDGGGGDLQPEQTAGSWRSCVAAR